MIDKTIRIPLKNGIPGCVSYQNIRNHKECDIVLCQLKHLRRRGAKGQNALNCFMNTPLSHRPKQGANFAWGRQSGAWGRAGNANLLGVASEFLGETTFSDCIILSCVGLTYPN